MAGIFDDQGGYQVEDGDYSVATSIVALNIYTILYAGSRQHFEPDHQKNVPIHYFKDQGGLELPQCPR